MLRAAIVVSCLIVCVAHGDPLTEAEKQAILDAHNATREAVAAGSMPDDGTSGTYPSATNMTRLVWNETLETVAQGWADQCAFAHNPNRTQDWYAAGGSTSVNFIGENIAWAVGQTITGIYDLWANEHTFWSYQPLQFDAINIAGHFTQIIWANTTEIGCAAATCNNGFTFRYVTCNYLPAGNFIGQTPYLAGPPQSSCPEGFAPDAGHLCAPIVPLLHPVPDGATMPGSAMTATRVGSQIDLTWDTTSCGTAVDYHLYAGTIGDFEAVVDAHCEIGPTGAATIPMPGESIWWVIASADPSKVGSFGQGDGGERSLTDWQAHCSSSTQSLAESCED